VYWERVQILVSLVMLGAHESRVYNLKMKWFVFNTMMSSCRMLMPMHVHVTTIQYEWRGSSLKQATLSKKLQKTNEIELSIKFMKERQNRAVDPYSRKLCVKNLLIYRTLEPILKVGWNFWDLIFPSLQRWRNFRILKKWGMHIGPSILDLGSAYARLRLAPPS
jgi:hypothetical protein